MNSFLSRGEAEDLKSQKISDGIVSHLGEIISDGNGSAQSATDETSGGSEDEVLQGGLDSDDNHLYRSPFFYTTIYPPRPSYCLVFVVRKSHMLF